MRYVFQGSRGVLAAGLRIGAGMTGMHAESFLLESKSRSDKTRKKRVRIAPLKNSQSDAAAMLLPIGHEVEVAQWRAVDAGVFLASASGFGNLRGTKRYGGLALKRPALPPFAIQTVAEILCPGFLEKWSDA